ncbi:MAG: hypothetical protein RI907_2547 [Pseudomonadota bacterium]
MAQNPDHISMALFCDFENVALGVRDANYDKFDIKRVLEKLLLKGSIVVKKAYCDWERYKGFKAAMHEANFELIEIPHVRQSGKNSADIRLVVDALDLCYTKSHVNTFVIISGDSDFSPLVSKLRENAKQVIGVGVKQSTSDLLIANCDEFIFYDDLVRDSQRRDQRRDQQRGDQPQPKRSPEEEARRKAEMDARRLKAVDMAVETYEALVTDRDEGGRIWASVLKEAIKRRNPGFNENYYGYRTFGNLLEDASKRGLIAFGRDEKSGTYVFRAAADAVAQAQAAAAAEAAASSAALADTASRAPEVAPEATPAPAPAPRRGRRDAAAALPSAEALEAAQMEATAPAEQADGQPEAEPSPSPAAKRGRQRNTKREADAGETRGGRGRGRNQRQAAPGADAPAPEVVTAAAPAAEAAAEPAPVATVAATERAAPEAPASEAAPAKKASRPRSRRGAPGAAKKKAAS